MTKKVVITYSMLFLFAFTFAFAFAMEARAEYPEPLVCCTVFCEGYPDRVSYYGWEDIHHPELGCQPPYNPAYNCFQFTYTCPYIGP